MLADEFLSTWLGLAWLVDRLFTNHKHESPRCKRDLKNAITMRCTFVTIFFYRLMARYFPFIFFSCHLFCLFPLCKRAIIRQFKSTKWQNQACSVFVLEMKKTCSSHSICHSALRLPPAIINRNIVDAIVRYTILGNYKLRLRSESLISCVPRYLKR